MARKKKPLADNIIAAPDNIEVEPDAAVILDESVPVIVLPEIGAGISCPACGCRDLRVLYTRAPMAGMIRRRRACRHCGRRMTTSERVEAAPGMHG